MTTIDQETLLRLRAVVARVGEMDLARWWNTDGQLGPKGAEVLRRGLPRTHYFAQARSVFAVASHRCDEVFNPPNSITLWRLPAQLEEQFDARWEHWLDNAREWEGFFERVAAIETADLAAALQAFDLADPATLSAVERLQLAPGGRSISLPSTFSGKQSDIELLAAAFGRGSVGSLTVPYARAGEE